MNIKKQLSVIATFIAFVSSAGVALSEVPSVNDNLTISLPCAEYGGTNYDIVLEPFLPESPAPYASGAPLWKLASIREVDSDAKAHCIKIQEENPNIIISEIQYNEKRYSLSLYPQASHETDNSPIWQAGTLFELAPAEKERSGKDSVSAQEVSDVVDGLNAFNVALYKNMVKEGKNLFYSPFSISTTLAMTYAGAKNETATQMESALHWHVDALSLHAGFNYIDLELETRGADAQGQDGNGFRLNIANNIWGQKDCPFHLNYLNLLSENYGANLALLDFMTAPDYSRQTINAWVSDQTEEKIKDLIPADAIGDSTRLILTNAVYFNAAWSRPFAPENTVEYPFQTSETASTSVPMMMQTEHFNYAESEEFQAVELFYDGRELSMLIVMPRENGLAEFENNMTPEKMNSIIDSMTYTNVALQMPRFKLKPDGLSLKTVLPKMGMPIAFTSDADFSGITDAADLFISDVIHKAFIGVDEAGTEAAAATAVIFVDTSIMPTEPVQMYINKPFLFMIRDIKTGVALFMGRVVSP